MLGVFDDDTHAPAAVLVCEIAEHPNAGLFHLNEGGDALSSPNPQHRYIRWSWQWVTIERDDFEDVSR